ncbi:hypothetical protein L2D14_16455 [Thalassospiraceae bacterium LMO-JJ14]|nr:hypothetical protein L2D14_16455 [Thalassospiraceae bacterium LMO-JJ14]
MLKKTVCVGLLTATLAACQTTGGYEPVSDKLASLSVALADQAWTGGQIPDGQQCKKFGGNGATPALTVSGIPAGANAIIVEFNDESYTPLSTNGGHGKIGFWIKGGSTAQLPSVPGATDTLTGNAFVEARNRATGSYTSAGYLPPCSGGRGNTYSADVKAVYKAKAEGEKSKLLAKGYIVIGKY